MGKYLCQICDWVYDPEIGDPDGGIEPGTKFEDIPDDWTCPLCGAGKDDFILIDDWDYKKMDNKENVLNAMKKAGKPVRPGEIADITGIDKNDLTKIFKDLKNEGKIISPKRCFYSLPD